MKTIKTTTKATTTKTKNFVGEFGVRNRKTKCSLQDRNAKHQQQ